VNVNNKIHRSYNNVAMPVVDMTAIDSQVANAPETSTQGAARSCITSELERTRRDEEEGRRGETPALPNGV
jgi:phytoene/squalene synthetase